MPSRTKKSRSSTPTTIAPFEAGLAKRDITGFEPGFSMWGWAADGNVAVGAETPLFARALVLAAGASKPFVFACLDLGMISESLRRAVLAELVARGLDVDEHRLTLTATHTHSGPSGFSTYLFYALGGPGFSPAVHDVIVRGTVDAIAEAFARRAPARVFVHAADVPLAEAVSFNRSLAAYRRNEDVDPVSDDRADEAVHRRMTVLRVEDRFGNPRGLVSFFAVHGTSVHGDFDRLHGDNKGLAATMCEREHGPDFVAIFAQESAGDVSPNYRPDKRRGFVVGRYDDDLASVEHNASIQARHALQLFRAARIEGRELEGAVDARLRYVRFHETLADADLAGGLDGRRTSAAYLGFNFSIGTAEGPGWLGGIGEATKRTMQLFAIASARRDGHEIARAQGRKIRMWALGPSVDRRIGDTFASGHPLLGLIRDRRVQYLREALAFRGVRMLPWVPHHLPMQLVTIGDLALAFIPFEPTTQSGRRLRKLVTHELATKGVRETILGGYANAYASYLTTPEEYDEQAYEGAVTLFGKWSLPAVGTRLREVARSMVEGAASRDVGEAPPHVPLEHWLPGGKSSPIEVSYDEPARKPRSISGVLPMVTRLVQTKKEISR